MKSNNGLQSFLNNFTESKKIHYLMPALQLTKYTLLLSAVNQANSRL